MRYYYSVIDVTGIKPKDLEKKLDEHGEAGQKFVGFYKYSGLFDGPSEHAIFEKSVEDPPIDYEYT